MQTLKHHRNNQEIIERIIDSVGLETVVAYMAAICHDKAAHLETNWQDSETAARWQQMGDRLETVERVARTKGL